MEDLSAVFVIVGGGIAGVSCVEGLFFLSPNTSMILVTPSPVVKAVSNIKILTKMLTQFDIVEQGADTLTDLYPTLSVVRDSLAEIDTEQRTIRTAGGKRIRYEKLCLCTGGQPKLIAAGHPCVIGIRDTDTVEEFQKRVKSARRIVIVGNGGIATEVAHEVDGVEMVWVVKDKHISATFVDAGAAEFFQSRLVARERSSADGKPGVSKRMTYTVTSDGRSKEQQVGAALGPDWHRSFDLRGSLPSTSAVTVEYECQVDKLMDATEAGDHVDQIARWPMYVALTNGKVIGCDLVVSATGVVPNGKALSDQLVLAGDGGVLVDWQMQTSLPDIYAAGDVCTARWDKAEHWFQMRLWTQARQMGHYAAKCMAAAAAQQPVVQDFCFEMFTHVTRLFGYKVVLLGLFNGQTLGGEYEVLLRMTPGVEYVKLVKKNGRLHGAILIGETDLEEMCENLILNQLDLTSYGDDLLNPDIDIEDYFD